MEAAGTETRVPPFVQPKRWLRWAAVGLAAAGWYVSLHSFRISAGEAVQDPLLRLVCGGDGVGRASRPSTDDCLAVLTSPQAYLPLSAEPGAPRIPLAAFGLGYFSFLGLWYLFVGPPTRAGRAWHLAAGVLVLCGAAYSAYYLHVMANVLHRWCGSCLAAHALNGGLILTTLLAWPWRRIAPASAAHPTARLALATTTAGVLAFVTQLAVVLLGGAYGLLNERSKQYTAVLGDPEFVLWDFHRQPEAELPLRDDEVFAGAPTAPNTLVVFSDFQCPACRQSQDMVVQAAGKYPDRLRVAFRYYPQDPECNPNPKFRGAGHGSACRAARAAEAARMVGGKEAYLAMRKLLWERQNELPHTPYAQQTRPQRQLFEDWAAGLGLARAAFAAAMDSPDITERIRADVELAERLGIPNVPALYLNGKRLRNWSKTEIWDALLGGQSVAPSQPTSLSTSP